MSERIFLTVGSGLRCSHCGKKINFLNDPPEVKCPFCETVFHLIRSKEKLYKGIYLSKKEMTTFLKKFQKFFPIFPKGENEK